MTTKKSAAHKSSPQADRGHKRDCVRCDIPPFCRTNYFTGRLLTEQDFTSEQRYLRDKMRLHYRALHGWGVACGLRVKPHPYCPDRRLVIEPGVAIDQCGYEIFLAREVEIDLPPAPAPQEAEKPGDGPGQDNPCRDRQEAKYGQQSGEPQQPEYSGEHSHPYVSNTPIYVCLRYAECETDFMPAPFDECGCNDAQGRRASRICETYTATLEYGTPEPLDTQASDCSEILQQACEPCPTPSTACCIPLAYLPRYVPGQTVTDEMIDNRSYRRLLPSTQLHDRLIRCILDRVSIEALTRVSTISWTHGQEYSCNDFIRFFTGPGSGASAFEVEFDLPVRPECLTPRVFQAVITRFGGPSGPGSSTLEIAPTRVWATPDGRSYAMQIDRDYADRELRGRWFDVYLTLRCNLVLDQRGRAVDGDLIAHLQEGDYVVSPPTGNGVPGGTLESWIRVRP